MALVVTIAQQKGGAGKTMLAANLAAAFAPTRRTVLFDIDPQHTLARWHAIRMARAEAAPEIGFSDVAGWRLAGELERLRRSYDMVVIDSPPQIDTDARRAIRAADLVLIPVQPSAPDLWAAEGTLELARSENRNAALVMNRAPTTTRLREKAEAEVRAAGHTLLLGTLGNRAGFVQAFAAGLGVMEAAPKSAAAAEMLALLEEIGRLLP